MSQDTLSDVLRSVRLRSAVFYYVSCDGNWVAEAPASRAIAAAVMPDAEHVIEYHVLTAGECWVGIVGEPPVKMKRGDIVLLPQGDAHVVSSAPGMRADPDISSYFDLGRAQRPFRIHHDNETPQVDLEGKLPAPGAQACSANFVCGFIGCDLRPFNPLIATLPRAAALAGRRRSARGASSSRRSPRPSPRPDAPAAKPCSSA